MLWEAHLRSSQARSSRLLRDRRALAALATCYILLWLWGRSRLQQTARSIAVVGSAARLGAPRAPLFAKGKTPAQDGSGARAQAAAQRSAPGGTANGWEDWEDLPALDDSEGLRLDRDGRVQLALYSPDPMLQPLRTGRTDAADAADDEKAPGHSNLGSSVAGHGGRRTGSNRAASMRMPGQSDLHGSNYPAARALRRRDAGAAHVHVDVQRGSTAAHAQAVWVRRTNRAERRGSAGAEEGRKSLRPETPGEQRAYRQSLEPNRFDPGTSAHQSAQL